tara:strand:- start:8291 stop:8488 length:198 start_codon:yes stop_codon:yes gene_type:complete
VLFFFCKNIEIIACCSTATGCKTVSESFSLDDAKKQHLADDPKKLLISCTGKGVLYLLQLKFMLL